MNQVLQRSKRSLQSLAAPASDSGSEVSFPSSFSLASPKPSLRSLRRSSSSLCLNKEVISGTESFQRSNLKYGSSSSTTSSIGDLVNCDEVLGRCTDNAWALSLGDSDNQVLFQWILFITLALQIPNWYIEEVINIVELHIQGFPILIVLSALPGLSLKKKRYHKERSKSIQEESLTSTPTESPQGSIGHLEQDDGYSQEPRVPEGPTTTQTEGHSAPENTNDEWGCFVDLDEHILEPDFILPKVSQTNLTILEEEEEVEA